MGRRSEAIQELLVHTKELEEYRDNKEAKRVPMLDAQSQADKVVQAFKTKGHKRAVPMLEGLPSPVADQQLLEDMKKLTAMNAPGE